MVEVPNSSLNNSCTKFYHNLKKEGQHDFVLHLGGGALGCGSSKGIAKALRPRLIINVDPAINAKSRAILDGITPVMHFLGEFPDVLYETP